jgi:hypothetical protein
VKLGWCSPSVSHHLKKQLKPQIDTEGRRFFPGKRGAFLLLSFGIVQRSLAATISLFSVADTTLIELEPNNNMGAQTHFSAGTTLNSNFNRGLFRFDLTGQIPAGSRIKSVTVALVVVGQPVDEPAESNFRLHRLLKPWGEGNKFNTNNIGRGALATTNEATWMHRFALTTNTWATPGGAATNDYVAIHSGEQFVYGPNLYIFQCAVSDVQDWLDHPETNFGWLLKTEDETVHTTARRFGSRENPFNEPTLTIDYVPAPQITNANITGDTFQFSFLADASQPYVVEYKNVLANTNGWTTFTNVPPPEESTFITISNLISTPRFYRVVAP